MARQTVTLNTRSSAIRLSVGVALFILFPIDAVAQATPAKTAPIWRTDLHQIGYSEGASGQRKYAEEIRIDFSGDDALLASFWANAASKPCKSSERRAPNDCHIHVANLDPRNGTILSTHEWQFSMPDGAVYPTNSGSFVLVNGNKLQLYTPDYRMSNEVVLPVSALRESTARVWISPTGNRLLADWVTVLKPSIPSAPKTSKRKSWLDQSYQAWEALYDTKDLKELERWEEDKLTESISDSVLAATGTEASPLGFLFPTPSRVAVRKFDEPGWHTVYDADHFSFLTRALLLNAHNIVVSESFGFVLLDTQGNELLREQSRSPGRGFISPDVYTSGNGSRFAVVLKVEHSDWLGFSDVVQDSSVAVYDTQERKKVFVLDLPNRRPKGKPRPLDQFALSPDGSLLAHSAAGIVEIYRIPESPTAAGNP